MYVVFYVFARTLLCMYGLFCLRLWKNSLIVESEQIVELCLLTPSYCILMKDAHK